jgi:CBS domain-containing protein
MKKAFYVRDLMTVGVPTVTPETDVTDIARFLIEHNLEEVVVLEEGHNVGIVGYSEILKSFEKASALQEASLASENEQSESSTLTAEDVMRHDVVTVPPDLPLAAVIQIMQDKHLRAVYLTHHAGGVEYPAAWLTYRHLLRFMAARSDEEYKDLGIHAHRQSPLETFIQRRDEARKRHKSTH